MTSFDISRTAPAIARASLRIHAPRAHVWAILSNLSAWPAWNPGVSRISVLGSPAAGVHFEWVAGGLFIRSRIEVYDAPQAIGWTGAAPLISARHVYRLTDLDDGGTLVETDESFSGLFARVLPGVARRMMDRALTSGLEALRAEAETPPRHKMPKSAA